MEGNGRRNGGRCSARDRTEGMARDIASKLKSPDVRQTKSDILIANFIERNLAELPFETAKSIAQSVGVSQMTVGRYLRRLGYDGLDDLKREMRSSASRTNPAISPAGQPRRQPRPAATNPFMASRRSTG